MFILQFYITFGLAIATITTCAQILNHTARAYTECTGSIKSYCVHNNETLVDLAIIILAVGTIAVLMGVGLIIYYVVLLGKAGRCTHSVDTENKESMPG
jgi:hypothetical protein